MSAMLRLLLKGGSIANPSLSSDRIINMADPASFNHEVASVKTSDSKELAAEGSAAHSSVDLRSEDLSLDHGSIQNQIVNDEDEPASVSSRRIATPKRVTRAFNPRAFNLRNTPSRTARSMTAVKAPVKATAYTIPKLISNEVTETAKWAMTFSHRRFIGSTASKDSDPKGEFWRFPKLPVELQLMIWKEAVGPRIVGMKGEVPAVAHACHNSRSVTNCSLKVGTKGIGIFLNPKSDILLLDESSFSPDAVYHQGIYHTLRCARVNYSMLARVERVAMTIREVKVTWDVDCLHCCMVRRLAKYLINIKEFIIIIRPGPEGAGYNDLYESGDKDNNPGIQNVIDEIKRAWGFIQASTGSKVDWTKVSLKFMRLEKWER